MDNLGRWTPVALLGTGAFGQVHLAWDRTDGRWVAHKRFTGQDELGLLRFVIESRIRVAHPHLVRSLAFRLVDDDAILITELARGGSLRQLMSRAGPLPASWVATAIGQVLDALAALHAHGVVHRDLKPANLLLRDPGAARPHVLVADFGIATWRTVSLTGVGAAIGTPGYLAPEYLDQSQPSPRSDLFAVGVVAAELLAGRRLIHQSSAGPDIPANWSTQLPLPERLAPKLAAVLRRMAEPDPTARYLDCAEAAEALRHAMPGEQAVAAVPGIDLLDGLPAGWTPDGPVATQPQGPGAAATPTTAPGWAAAGPQGTAPATESARSAPAAAQGWAADDPHSPQGTAPATESAQSAAPTAAQNPATSAPHTPQSTTPPATGPAQPAAQGWATGGSRSPQSTGPAIGSAQSSPRHDTNSDAATTYLSPSSGPIPLGPATPTAPMPPPSGPTPITPNWHQDPEPKKKRRTPALIPLAVVLVLAASGIYWAATHNTAPGSPEQSGPTPPTAVQHPAWTPEPLAPCALAERGATRTIDGKQARCQRTSADEQQWVAEPAGGFPISNPSGPFPGEACGTSPDRDYSPVGVPVHCAKRRWVVGA